MALNDWSTTAASNASVGPINWAEGMFPSGVNDSSRAMMADVAKVVDGTDVLTGWHVKANGLTIHDQTDPTKKVFFDVSGQSAGTTKTMAMPLTAGTLALTSDLTDFVSPTTGTWTPAITFATAGNLSVSYSTQFGSYIKIGSLVLATFQITTSSFTHTTASGNFQITGLPFSSENVANQNYVGAMNWRGITKANYTDVVAAIAPNSSVVVLIASGSGQAVVTLGSTDIPTGGTLSLSGTIFYKAA